MSRKLHSFENAHILLWLIKDTCWALDLHWLGVLMIVPTLSVAAYIAYQVRANRDALIHNSAVCFWITANATWMTGEFFFHDSWRPYALIFFTLGLTTLAVHYMGRAWSYRQSAAQRVRSSAR